MSTGGKAPRLPKRTTEDEGDSSFSTLFFHWVTKEAFDTPSSAAADLSTIIVPNDAPAYVERTLQLASAVAKRGAGAEHGVWDDKTWKDVVGLWIEIDKRSAFKPQPGRVSLTTEGRPEAVEAWVKRARRATFRPEGLDEEKYY
ncbi:hypothetical protein MPER_01162, partial [Moniliophthora perniciosa FA553]